MIPSIATPLARAGLALALGLLAACGGDGGASQGGQPVAVVETTPVPGESRMLSGTAATPLMHPVHSIGSVYSYGPSGERIEYAEGVDYVVEGSAIRRTPQSRIPDYSTYSFVRNPDGRFSFTTEPRNPPRTIRLATYVDYRAALAPALVVAKPLPRTPANIVCLGDSITHAADTAAFFFRQSPADGWCALLGRHLADRARVTLPEQTFGFLPDVAPALTGSLGPEVDTVILAFGMNDQLAGEAGVDAFRTLLSDTVGDLRARGKNVVLVGFFQQNELWDLEKPSDTVLYNRTIREVAAAQGVPFVDMERAMREAAPASEPVYKHLTGDFLHHPNTYGQKIYFSLIVPHFLAADTRADAIADYVMGPWSSR